MNAISAIKPYACHRCNQSYSRRYNLQRHEENAHGADESDMDDIADDRNIGTFRSGNSHVSLHVVDDCHAEVSRKQPWQLLTTVYEMVLLYEVLGCWPMVCDIIFNDKLLCVRSGRFAVTRYIVYFEPV